MRVLLAVLLLPGAAGLCRAQASDASFSRVLTRFEASVAVQKPQLSAATLERQARWAQASNLLNQMLLRLMAANGIAPVSMKPASIVDTDVFNAYSAGDGTITVYKGLLERVHSDSELAFVLGHETAHWTLHHQRDIGMLAREMERARWYYWLNGQTVTGHVLEQGRLMESEADRMGMVYAVRAGYDAAGFESLFDDVRLYAKPNPRHPPADSRRRDMERFSGVAGKLKANDAPADYLAQIQALLQ